MTLWFFADLKSMKEAKILPSSIPQSVNQDPQKNKALNAFKNNVGKQSLANRL